MAVNPKAFEKCVAWRVAPGYSHACNEMCTKEQVEACRKGGKEEVVVATCSDYKTKMQKGRVT